MKLNCKPLDLDDYQSEINLYDPFEAPEHAPKEQIKRAELVKDLLMYLITELPENHRLYQFNYKNSSYKENRDMVYRLLTIREPKPLSIWFNTKLDSLLQLEVLERGITKSAGLPRFSKLFPDSHFKNADRFVLWLGDITTIQIDAIVNAANKSLLGCFRPFHLCIDNAIHSIAGPRLREDCNLIIKGQGCSEETGLAKVTRAYNLPSKFVIHTVGPIFDSTSTTVSPTQEKELANCYVSCLNLVNQIPTIKSIAFCSISTGVFGFPIVSASKIALKTVDEWLASNPNSFDYVVFNVFSKDDYKIYEKSIIEGYV